MPKISGEPIGSGIQSSALAFEIIDHLVSSRKAVGVTALAQALNVPKSRIYRHIQTLVEQGFMSQLEDSDRYSVGSRLLTLGRKIVENVDIAVIGRPFMEALRDKLGHAAAISIPDSNGARVLVSVRGTSTVEVSVKTGALLDYNSSAQGKLLAAFGGDEHLSRALAGSYKPVTDRTLVTRDALQAEFDTVRTQGWAKSSGEFAIGLNAVAAPILDSVGAVHGMIGIIDTAQRLPDDPRQDQIGSVLDAASNISFALGFLSEAPTSRAGG
jgi:IclR family transcriptional regulator, KDG regulon repressor